MKLKELKKVYFLGIGGIGMSAIARYFNHLGIEVSGYDKTKTALTTLLEKEGINIHYQEKIKLIPENLDLVVYTPAIPKNNKEFVHLNKINATPILKRARVLGEIAKQGKCIAIAGSHGKTTITCMLSHVLHSAGYNCYAFIGGISINYQTNFLAGNDKNPIFIVEADEFDRSFHQLHPDIAVITAIDDDHLEVYGNKEGLITSFNKFMENIDSNGLLIIKYGLNTNESCYPNNFLTYHFSDNNADLYVKNLRIDDDDNYRFDTAELTTTSSNKETWAQPKSLVLAIGGEHNIENAIPVIAIAKKMGLSEKEIFNGLKSFKGIKRRFEFVIKNKSKCMIDDYAHHPEELNALIRSVKNRYLDKKICLAFQPHLYSRTKDLAKQFADALSAVDEVVLLDIYPARELPVEGVTSQLIADFLINTDKKIYSKHELVDAIAQKEFDVLVFAGAGDISDLILPMKNALLRQG